MCQFYRGVVTLYVICHSFGVYLCVNFTRGCDTILIYHSFGVYFTQSPGGTIYHRQGYQPLIMHQPASEPRRGDRNQSSIKYRSSSVNPIL